MRTQIVALVTPKFERSFEPFIQKIFGPFVMQLFSFLVLAWVFMFPAPAYAYLDPGMGSLILQTAIGAIAGGLVVLKLYWGRFKSLLSGFRQKTETSSKD